MSQENAGLTDTLLSLVDWWACRTPNERNLPLYTLEPISCRQGRLVKIKTNAKLLALGVFLGTLPLSASSYLFLAMITARKSGHPYAGDAIGLMMMSLLAYAIALISCLIGTLYFGVLFVKYRSLPHVWEGIILIYALCQTILPIIYLVNVSGDAFPR